MTRRRLLGVIASLPFVRVAESADTKNDRVDQAMERGADYFLNVQQPNGEFSSKMSDPMTALGIMALASMGNQPSGPGKYGRVLRQALNFIMREKPSRYYKNDPKLVYFGADGSRMYAHGITTLCLTEMLGMGVGKEQENLIKRSL